MMLLDEIIDLGVDKKQSLTAMLLKCVVLAAQLKNDRLKTWANQELNGYKDGSNVPEYRALRIAAYGTFVGPGGTIPKFPIPSIMMKENHRHMAEEVSLVQPVSVYEDLLSREDSSGEMFFPWPGNLIALYQRVFLRSQYALVRAWQEVPRSAIVQILDTVRTRTLNIALEIKEEIGEDIRHLSPAAIEKVAQTVNNYIGTTVIASGQAQVQFNQMNIGDWEQLAKVLKNQSGLTDDDVAELKEADRADSGKMGAGVGAWIKKMAPKALVGGLKLGSTLAQQVLTEVIKRHYGLSD